MKTPEHLSRKLGRRDIRLLKQAVEFYIENKPIYKTEYEEIDNDFLEQLLCNLEDACGGEFRESQLHFSRRTNIWLK